MPPASPRHCRRGPFALLLALALAALLAPAPAVAQPPNTPKKQLHVAGEGTELFRALLDRKGIQPVKRQDAWPIRRPAEVIVIAFGPPTNNEVGPLAQMVYNTVNSGGAGLIACDEQLSLNRVELGNAGGAAIYGGRADCPDRDSVLAIRDPQNPNWPPERLRDCPYVVPLTEDDVLDAPHPDSAIGKVFDGLTRVATNAPGYIQVNSFTGLFRFPLAKYPNGTTWLADNGLGRMRPANALFAVGGSGELQRNSYRFLAMADHSVFINQMLIEPGTDNLELAYRTIEFLQGPNERKRCLFIENGRIVEEFDTLRKAFANQNPMGMPNLWANQDKLTDIANKIVAKIEDENVPNNVLLGIFGLTRIMWFVLIVASIYVTVYLLRRWTAARKPTDQPPPPTVAAAPSGPPGVFDRRQKELLRRDNVYEPVRDLVREFFASLGIHGEQGPRHPKLVISASVRKPDSLRQAVRDFWKLAFGPPQEVTVARWRELEPYLIRLRDAHADGKWRFVMPGAPVAASV
jgi:hypothetical protein